MKTGWRRRYVRWSYYILSCRPSSDNSFLEFPEFQIHTETRREERLPGNTLLHGADSNDNPKEDTGHG